MAGASGAEGAAGAAGAEGAGAGAAGADIGAGAAMPPTPVNGDSGGVGTAPVGAGAGAGAGMGVADANCWGAEGAAGAAGAEGAGAGAAGAANVGGVGIPISVFPSILVVSRVKAWQNIISGVSVLRTPRHSTKCVQFPQIRFEDMTETYSFSPQRHQKGRSSSIPPRPMAIPAPGTLMAFCM
jgi:hypothetical protein